MMLPFIYFMTLIIFPYASSLSFNFTSFDPDNKSIIYEDVAAVVAKSIQMTGNKTDNNMLWSVGRATYDRPIQLWNKTTNNLIDFTTYFSFVIDSFNRTDYADGLAFFITPYNHSEIIHPRPKTSGGGMGLIPQNSTNQTFVAVEFDIFQNEWDPADVREHVGVDINSLGSVATEPWLADIREGRLNEAWINYNSTSLNLSIIFTGFTRDTNHTPIQQHLSTTVDLRLYLPEFVALGFTAATGSHSAIHTLHSWNFSSTMEAQQNIAPAGKPHTSPATSNVALAPSQKTKAKAGLGVGLGIGGSVLIAGLVWISIVLWKKWNNGTEEEEEDSGFEEYMGEDFGRGTGPRQYSYAELSRAANNFKEDQKLGEGGFGSVYRGHLTDTNSYVAIKKVSESSKQGMKEFTSEVRIISQLRHRNLVQLIGWCQERKKLLLVYEYMPNGSLDFHLFNYQSFLTWALRYKIAQGLASALLYLHEEWKQCVLHRDIKASNIMLDSEFNAKLGDFGLARLVDHAKGAQTTALAGTLGYMAPECAFTGRASKESDVYSFGIVSLEIACGRKPINFVAREDEINIVGWVWGLYGSGRILEAADPRLDGYFENQQIKCLMIVGLWCAHPDHNNRPSIRQAIQVLNFEAPLPNLPSSIPVPTYLDNPPPSSMSLSSIIDPEERQNQNISLGTTSYTNPSGVTSTF